MSYHEFRLESDVPTTPGSVPLSPCLPRTQESTPGTPTPTRRRSPRTMRDKMTAVLQTMDDAKINLSQFLYELFLYKDSEGQLVKRDSRHISIVSRFLKGTSTYTFGEIIALIRIHPSAKPDLTTDTWREDWYSPGIKPSEDIIVAGPHITTLAVELVTAQLVREMKTVVKGSEGLHGSLKSEAAGRRSKLQWSDIGPATVEHVKSILEKKAPLATHLILRMATPLSSVHNNGVRTVRMKQRPPDLTSAEILSSIIYCRSPFARLLPIARAILYFACGAQETLFRYGSRVSHLPSWNTTVTTLKRLAAMNAEALRTIGTNPQQSLFIRFDNVQVYVKRHEQRIGSENFMNIGIAATAWEARDYTTLATDVHSKQEHINANLRADLTVTKLLQMIDMEHLRLVGALQWLQTLTQYVPQLEKYRGDVAELYRTEAAKFHLPPEASIGHPLSTVAKNENMTTELRDALIDFLNQIGQSDESHQDRLHFVGGDGLTFERLLYMKRIQRHQDNAFRRLDIVQPFLEMWHTQWTYVSTIFEGHYDSPLSKDPSTLGHNMTKINQKPVNNVKKVDYYPAAYSAYLILDCRMLDCWRIHLGVEHLEAYFNHLESIGKLPTLEELRQHAVVLHQRYATEQAYRDALTGTVRTDNVASNNTAFPKGAPWSAVSKDSDTKGDQALARSIAFMRDTILAREASQAVAEGDSGRLYEVIKIMLFYFAGSSHSKYVQYLLETVCDLKLESNPEYKRFYLRNILLNPSGEPHRFQEGDLTQEHYNKELETYISRANSQWDSEFIRNVVSPNVHHFNMLKNRWGEGVGLSKRRGAHTTPHSRPEVKTLLQIYKDEDLHQFRASRGYDTGSGQDVDMFTKGIIALEEGKLKKWTTETTRVPRIFTGDSDEILGPDDVDEPEDMVDQDQSAGMMRMVDGELVVVIEESNWYADTEQDEAELCMLEFEKEISGNESSSDIDEMM